MEQPKVEQPKVEQDKVQMTWKPVAAGVLMIISGALGIANGARAVAGPFPSWFDWVPGFGQSDPGLIAAGVVAIVGGVFALQRKLWPLALAGSILSFPCMGLFGLLSLIWVAQRRREFTGYK